jgi:ribosomal protein L29
MAILKAKEISKMKPSEIKEKLVELKIELIKSKITTKKTGKGTKEIKRTIARLKTFLNNNKEKKNKEVKK